MTQAIATTNLPEDRAGLATTAQSRFAITGARFRETRQYPLAQPFADASMGPFATFGFATLELTDADGCTAENFVFGMCRDILEAKLLPILMQSGERPYAEVYADLFWAIRNDGFRSNSASILGQLDHIIHGLAATRAGLPLHRYWGATQDWAHVYASGGGANYSDAQLRAELTRFLDEGYSVVKIKVGKNRGRERAADLHRVKLAREVLGPDIQLAVDANQTFTADEAIDFARQLAEFDIHWFEEPVHSAALHEIARVCQESPVPIAYGESEKSSKIFPTLVQTGIAQLQPIVGYQASIAEWFEGHALSRAAGIGFSSGGFSHASAQAVAACGTTAWTELLNPIMESYQTYCRRYPEVREGRFLLDQEPGFSLDFDWAKIESDGLLKEVREWTPASFASHQAVVN
jgi:L-alanine-DL-glutamate epimerase-like enolase superfamily enzyme